jgi:hypothetical protein
MTYPSMIRMTSATVEEGSPLDRVLSRLRGVRPSGAGFIAFCPAHDDCRHRSLSVRETSGGMVLLYCFAGCAFGDMVHALGLRPRDLFPPR